MRVYKSDSTRVERVPLNHVSHLKKVDNLNLTEPFERPKRVAAVAERTQGDLRHHEGMHDDVLVQ